MAISFPRVRNDLNEVYGDFKKIVNTAIFFLKNPKEAPPTVRHHDVSFIPLHLSATGEQVGCFVAEFYELAKLGQLECQIEFERWHTANPQQAAVRNPYYNDLYINGNKKSAFELALLPFIYNDLDQKSKEPIQKRMEREFCYRKKNGLPLPAIINKFLVIDDYLKFLPEQFKPGVMRDLTLNLLNPADETKAFERTMHYLAQRISLLIVLGSACAAAGASTAFFFPVAFAGVFLAEWCAIEFGVFSTAEQVMRELNWMSDPRLAISEELSLKKIVKTSGLVASLLTGATYGAIGTWSLVMTALTPVSLFGVAGILAAPAAALAATAVGLGILGGGIASQRFFWGLGINYKQIDFSKPENSTTNVVALHTATVEEKHDHRMDKTLNELGVSFENRQEIRGIFTAAFAAAKNRLEAIKNQPQPAVANDAALAEPNRERAAVRS